MDQFLWLISVIEKMEKPRDIATIQNQTTEAYGCLVFVIKF